MTFAGIEGRGGEWPVTPVGRVPEVSRAGPHAWRSRTPSATAARRDERAEPITARHAGVTARYGRPRAHAGLVGRRHECGVSTVARALRGAGRAAKTARKFRRATDPNRQLPVAEDVLDRQSGPDAPNAPGVAGVTDIPTREGWLYPAAVGDLFRRRAVGWPMAAAMTSRRVVDAPDMAVARRPEGRSGRVAHADRGSPYARDHSRRRPPEERIGCRMRRRGNCRGHAPMGSFFASLRADLIHDEDDAARAEARARLFEGIEAFYHRARRHSSPGYVAPAEYERTHNLTHR